MGSVNIKIDTQKLKKLKAITGESTGQKAVSKALEYIFREAEQRTVIDVLRSISFGECFDILNERKRER